MEILPKRIYETLKDKGVSSIWHADSVENTCLFLKHRCLMSRDYIEKLDSQRTMLKPSHSSNSYSDRNDIFADSLDIHKSANKAHSHGPVLFELDIEIIKNTFTGKVWVTKSNPMEWDNSTHHENRWFVSANDLESNFSYGSFDHMVVFRHCAGKLPLLSYLNRVVIDDPKLQTDQHQVDYFSMAYGAIKLSMREGGFDVPVERRACNKGCDCLNNYKGGVVRLDGMFNL
ncbi:MAG: hypothetical protein ABW104_03850 [Candidatus Thiodiazotropha sp. 6PLUC2]